jgi:hypothetical protein
MERPAGRCTGGRVARRPALERSQCRFEPGEERTREGAQNEGSCGGEDRRQLPLNRARLPGLEISSRMYSM